MLPRWTALSDKIHANPETNFKEFKACKWLTEEFRSLGFRVETGVGGIETAFKAVYDSGKPGPTVGVIIEYDALEGLGHACAHNCKGPAALCAVNAFLNTCEDFRGKIIVYGCPAEEGGGGKVIMADAGVFNDSDVCFNVGVAPGYQAGIRLYASQGLTVTFKGRAGHAGMTGIKSINALDPLVYTLQNLDYLRKYLGEDGLIHAVISSGGISPAVIPDLVEASIRVRAVTPEILYDYVSHVEALVRLAAEISCAQVQLEKSLVYLDYVKCPSLTGLIMDNFRELGINATCLLDKKPRGSSDVGNVSRVVPTDTIHCGLGEGLSPHTVGYREAAGGEAGHNLIKASAKVLSGCIADLLTKNSSQLLARIKAEFRAETQKAGQKGQKQPSPLSQA